MDSLTSDRVRRRPLDAGGAEPDDAVYHLTDVIRVYREHDVETIALRGVDLSIQPGEFVAVMGRSGSGKSTLLNLLAGSDRPTAGRVLFKGRDLSLADERARSEIRGREIGIVYQAQNLAAMLSLLENVHMAAWLADRPMSDQEALTALHRVGLGDRHRHRPANLSGGEQQRAALACVLVARPTVLLADEITGELDRMSARSVLDVLHTTHLADGTTVVLVTHDPDVAAGADRIVGLRDGVVAFDRRLR